MDKPRLNLNDLIPLWERKFSDPVHKPVRESDVWSNVDISRSASIQEIVGKPGSLSQDAFSTLVIRQGRVQRTL